MFELIPHHCGIFVPDIESSIAWYRDILGFTLSHRSTLTRGEIPRKVAFMKHGDFYIELFDYADAAPFSDDVYHKTCGTKHIAFDVQDLPQIVYTLKSRGVEIVFHNQPETEPRLENRPRGVAFIRDNAGTLIELIEGFSP
ncbi:MAG: hypothetical protein A2144_08830 [Chloroflexi bacterium RBG_16_50_9]|nr:MAG: hypothetical protein A2144_08830 [Chloroflexi bacterium RBG_16_50_9]